MDANHCATLRAFRSTHMRDGTQVLWTIGYESIRKSASFSSRFVKLLFWDREI
jgi:hypothetical protein